MRATPVVCTSSAAVTFANVLSAHCVVVQDATATLAQDVPLAGTAAGREPLRRAVAGSWLRASSPGSVGPNGEAAHRVRLSANVAAASEVTANLEVARFLSTDIVGVSSTGAVAHLDQPLQSDVSTTRGTASGGELTNVHTWDLPATVPGPNI